MIPSVECDHLLDILVEPIDIIIMELHSIWTRIEQLEKLIISQAKEIDLLRRVINSMQMILQAGALPIMSPATDIEYPKANQPTMCNHIQSNPGQTKVGNEIMSTTTTHSSYKTQPLMNSFVHPISAIPPVSNRIVANGAINGLNAIPKNPRWSTGPSLLGTIADTSNREINDTKQKNRNKFSLIELVTCFCPCFNMC